MNYKMVWRRKFMTNYDLKSTHLGFRLLEEKDIQYLEKLESDPEVRKYFPVGEKTQEKIMASINKHISFYKEKGLPSFVIFELDSGEFVGRIGLGSYITGEIEVGYSLHQKFWGRGYGTEALMLILKWAKNNIKTNYIIGVAVPENVGSLRVMEKCGMEYYKTDIDQGDECHFYRIKN
jgi:ribosomal-protein-alanine N-acetyltransferase